MGIDPEVFNSTVADHSHRLTMLFLKKSPLQRQVLSAGNIDKSNLGSSERRFTVMTGGPGVSTTYQTGREQRPVGLRPTSEVGKAYTSLETYDYAVPVKVLDEANGKDDAVKLIKKYPEAALGDIAKGHALQFATGQSATLTNGDRHYHPGMMTLMGARTYTANGVTYQGLLEPCAPASQDGLVLGLRSEGHADGVEYNQFAETSGYSGDGVQKLRDICLEANAALEALTSSVSIAMADKQSYSNHITAVEGKFETQELSSDTNIMGPTDPMTGIKIGGASTILFRDEYIDLSKMPTVAYNGAAEIANEGVIYVLNPETFYLFELSNELDPKNKKGTLFKFMKPQRAQDVLAYIYTIKSNFGMYCESRPANGIMIGSAQ
jgi:hypothetical protein